MTVNEKFGDNKMARAAQESDLDLAVKIIMISSSGYHW